MTRRFLILGVLTVWGAATGLAEEVTYQGQLKRNGLPLSGDADLRFTLHNSAAGGPAAGNPAMMCGVPVKDGLFTAELDFGPGVFDGSDRWLMVEVRSPSDPIACRLPGGGSFEKVTPLQKINAAPYASHAYQASWDGIVNMPGGFADGVDDAGGLTMPYFVEFTGSDETAFSVVQHGLGGAASFASDDPNNYYNTLFTTANGAASTYYSINSGTGSAGQFQILNANSSGAGVLSMTNGTGAAVIGMATGNGYGVTGSASGAGNGVQGSVSGTGNAIQGKVTGNDGRAGYFEVSSQFNSQNAVEIQTAGNSDSQAIWAEATGTGDCGVFIIDNVNNAGECVEARTTGTGHAVEAVTTGTGRAGYFAVNNANNQSNAVYVTSNGRGPAVQSVATGESFAGRFDVTNPTSSSAALFVKTVSNDGPAAIFQLVNSNSNDTAVIISNTGNGDSLKVQGLAAVDVLRVEGGSDLSEGFDISGAQVSPGMVVVIDPDRPGKLRVSTRAYDTRVAGVISGAGGVRPGMLMGQRGTIAQGDHPVALTGRVYCMADASIAAIEPGDMLTTSAVPGHAMRAVDRRRAPGAVIGKAMTGLTKGERGLVLVLVNLQ